jgi:hypothetical protein
MKEFASRRWCYHAPTKFLELKKGKVSYYVADRLGVREFDGDLIINLTERPGPRAGSTTYNIPSLGKHMQKLPDEIVLAWNDFSTPPVQSSFWGALHDHVILKKYKHVCFHCEHGHGRTGTAAAAMIITLQQLDVETSVNYIREVHCNQAVESDMQIQYLIDLDAELNGNNQVDSKALGQKLNRKPLASEESGNDPFDFSSYIKRMDR